MINRLIEFLMNNEVEKEKALSLFWRGVDKSVEKNGCWVWTKKRSYQSDSDYGLFTFKSLSGQTFVMAAHRFSLAMKGGEDRDLLVCHSCDNPPCVRPEHLWYGTHLENMKDKASKGRGLKKRSPLEVTESIVEHSEEILDEKTPEVGRHRAMKIAIEYAVNKILKGGLVR